MEQRKSTFDDHMTTIEAGHSKAASATANAEAGENLLSKLAAELGMGDDKNQAAAAGAQGAPEAGAPAGTSTENDVAPAAEGEVIPAASAVTGAAPAVAAATDAVAMPQVEMAGGVPAVAEAGSAPNPEVAVMPIISAGTGDAQTANDLARTPEAVAAAAVNESEEEMAEAGEAEKVGALIARSFQATLEKSASDEEYSEAVGILKEAGLLEGYNIQDEGIAKTASVADGYLEKIANMQPLTREDIVGAAYELGDFQKQAELADMEGREAAHAMVDMISKVAGEETVAEPAAVAEDGDAQTKVANLLQDPEVVGAVKVLKANGLL